MEENAYLKKNVAHNNKELIKLGFNVVFIPRCLVRAVQDDISTKNVPI